MMLLALAAPYLAWLELWYVFYPLAVVLLFAGVISMPTDRPGYFDSDGVPLLSLLCNVLLFTILVRHFNVSIEDGWGVKVVSALAAIYLLFGIVWSFDKWRRFVGHAKEDIQTKIASWCSAKKISWPSIRQGTCTEEEFVEFYKWMIHESRIHRYVMFPALSYRRHDEGQNIGREYCEFAWPDMLKCIVPRVTEHKAQVIMWLACWPMSVIKWLLADMVTDLVNLIFNSLRRLFQGVADRSFSEL